MPLWQQALLDMYWQDVLVSDDEHLRQSCSDSRRCHTGKPHERRLPTVVPRQQGGRALHVDEPVGGWAKGSQVRILAMNISVRPFLAC